MISDVKTRPVPYDLQSDEPSKDWRGYPVHPNWKYVLLDHGHETYLVYVNEIWDFYDEAGAQVDEDENGVIFNIDGKRIHEDDLFDFIVTNWCEPMSPLDGSFY